MKIKFIVPFPFDEEIAKPVLFPEATIPSNVELVLAPVKNSGKGADNQYDLFLMEMFCFEEGLKAEREGFDAVIVGTMTDSGLSGLRSRLKIPVIGPAIVCYHLASILGLKFSIITTSNKWLHLYQKSITEMQLWPKVASIRAAGIESELLESYSEETFERNCSLYEQTALKCIEEDGASVIVLGVTTFYKTYEIIKSRLPCPVIEPGTWALKIAVMLLELGLSHSKVCYPSPVEPQDDTIFSRLAPA
jgi:allantoin racemase